MVKRGQELEMETMEYALRCVFATLMFFTGWFRSWTNQNRHQMVKKMNWKKHCGNL
jgi:hypothetical protein